MPRFLELLVTVLLLTFFMAPAQARPVKVELPPAPADQADPIGDLLLKLERQRESESQPAGPEPPVPRPT